MPIVNPKTGKAVEPSAANVENSTYAPLSHPIFIYVKANSLDKPEVKYVPLPAKAYTGDVEHMNKRKLGTVFGGHNEIGITIEDLMKREAKG